MNRFDSSTTEAMNSHRRKWVSNVIILEEKNSTPIQTEGLPRVDRRD